jgi:hypothetical protein
MSVAPAVAGTMIATAMETTRLRSLNMIVPLYQAETPPEIDANYMPDNQTRRLSMTWRHTKP